MNVEVTNLISSVNDVDIVVNPFVLARTYGIPESGMQHYQTHKGNSIEGFDLNEELKKYLNDIEQVVPAIKINLDEATKKQTAKHVDFHDEGTLHRLSYELKKNFIKCLADLKTNLQSFKKKEISAAPSFAATLQKLGLI
ncbi:hypothetical protein QYF36_015816 [Acer negundo]|nr:hypothetical protein QYF36_015816 [Acer negundo]